MPHRIILFDDVQANREQVLGALQHALRMGDVVIAFEPGISGLTGGTHDDRLVADLQTGPNKGASLIVADRDLSSYTEHYRGLSEATVRLASDELGIPECGYARGERTDDKDYVETAEQREGCIRLSLVPDLNEFAKKVMSIADGFAVINSEIPGKQQNSKNKSLGNLLAEILGRPDEADKISLFASGDQGRLSGLAGVRKMTGEEERRRRLACLLGYWLWDSVLRFPGVVVNEIAASSYLNIQEADFQIDDIQALFQGARYDGPFAVAKERLWWRGALSELYEAADCADGRAYVEKTLKRKVRPSQCSEDPARTAGYYCFLTKRPVSLEMSRPGLPWFPRGADLARVSLSAYDELGPWL